jgi:hypothetical protein
MSGCRYAFRKFMNMIQTDLNINFNITTNINHPPKLQQDKYDDYLIKLYDMILKLMGDDTNTNDVLMSLKILGSINTDYINLENDLENETLIKVIKNVIYICENSIDTVNVISLSTLNILLKFCNEQLKEPSWLDNIKQLYEREYNKLSEIENMNDYNKLSYFQITKGMKLLTS